MAGLGLERCVAELQLPARVGFLGIAGCDNKERVTNIVNE